MSLVSAGNRERTKPRPGTPTVKPSKKTPDFIEIRKLNDEATLCQLDGTSEFYIVKPHPDIDLSKFRPRNKEYFMLPLSRFADHFVTEYSDMGTLEDSIAFIHERPNVDQRLCYFILLQLVRVLQGLEEAGLYHGNLSVLSFTIRSQSEALGPFDDGALWKQTGFSLNEVDQLKEGNNTEDRVKTAQMFWFLATKNGWDDSHPLPKRYNKNLWNTTFDTLLKGGDLKKLDAAILNYLKGESQGTKSIVSRLLVYCMNQKK